MALRIAMTARYAGTARAARRGATLLLGAALLAGVTAAPAAFATTPSSPSPSTDVPAALYGSKDPTYDGVWRQSTALLALSTVKVTPASEAVEWLLGQQCDNGGFPSYRVSHTAPCERRSEDVDSTALAVQALAALGGHDTAVHDALAWLSEVQNTDGGWGYQPDQPSDANSTAVVIGALASAGKNVTEETKGGKSAYDALFSFQLGCTASAPDRGAFAYQPDNSGNLTANAKATVDAAFAALGKGYAFPAPQSNADPKPLDCSGSGGSTAAPGSNPAGAADAASAYLAATLSSDGEHLTSAQPGSSQTVPDYGSTADAVIALAAGGHLDAAKKPYAWLTKNATAWAKDNPAALGSLILAADATGSDPRAFGGTDLVQQLENAGPKPQSGASANATNAQRSGGASGSLTWWVVGAGLIAGIGIGWAFSMRNKKHA